PSSTKKRATWASGVSGCTVATEVCITSRARTAIGVLLRSSVVAPTVPSRGAAAAPPAAGSGARRHAPQPRVCQGDSTDRRGRPHHQTGRRGTHSKPAAASLRGDGGFIPEGNAGRSQGALG